MNTILDQHHTWLSTKALVNVGKLWNTAWTVNVVPLFIVHVDNAGFSEFFPSCLPERNWISESILDNAALLQQYPHMDNAAFSLPRGYPEWMLQYCRGIVQHCLIGFQSQFWTMPHYCSSTPTLSNIAYNSVGHFPTLLDCNKRHQKWSISKL